MFVRQRGLDEMKHDVYPAAVILLLVTASPMAAIADEATCFEVSSDDGDVGFEVEQAGTAFSGSFQRFGGTVCMNGAAVARVDVWIDPASVETGLPELDAALTSPEFFDVEQYPRATFVSSDVCSTGEGSALHGTLTVNGIAQPMDVPFRLSDDGDGYRVTGRFDVHRLDFGVGTGEWADTRWLSDVTSVSFSGHLQPPVPGG